MEANNARDAHTAALQIGNTASHPVWPHADGSKVVHASLGAQVVDLRLGGIEFEEGMVDRAGDGGGEVVGRPWARVDGGYGRCDHRGPFGVGIAGCCCHCGCCWFMVGLESVVGGFALQRRGWVGQGKEKMMEKVREQTYRGLSSISWRGRRLVCRSATAFAVASAQESEVVSVGRGHGLGGEVRACPRLISAPRRRGAEW